MPINTNVEFERSVQQPLLAQLLVLAAFIPANKKTALRRIHLAYAGMDLELLVGEPIDPDGLSDELFAAMLDRLHEAGCEEFFSSIAFTVRTIFDLPQISHPEIYG